MTAAYLIWWEVQCACRIVLPHDQGERDLPACVCACMHMYVCLCVSCIIIVYHHHVSSSCIMYHVCLCVSCMCIMCVSCMCVCVYHLSACVVSQVQSHSRCLCAHIFHKSQGGRRLIFGQERRQGIGTLVCLCVHSRMHVVNARTHGGCMYTW